MITINDLKKDVSGQYILTVGNSGEEAHTIEQLVIDPRTGMNLQKLLNKMNGIKEEEPQAPFHPKSIFAPAVPGTLPVSKSNQ